MRGERGKPAPDRSDVLERARVARASRARRRGAVLIALGFAVVPVVVAIGFAVNYHGARQSGGSSGGSSTLPLAITVSVGIALSGPLLLRGRPFHDMVGLGGARKTYELRLADILGDVAPLVAIGDPTETLPRLGAARVYARDDEWHRTVDDLLDRGGAIILHAGDSPGLDWEVEHIVGLGQPERLILSLPLSAGLKGASRGQSYAAFRTRLGTDFPHGLPEGADDTHFMYFDADWTAHRLEEPGAVPAKPVPGSPGEQRSLVLRKLAPEFKRMWAPLWARALTYTAVVGVAVIALAAVFTSGNSNHAPSSPPRLDVARVEQDATPILGRLLRTNLHDATAKVDSLTCVATSSTTASCQVSASDAHGRASQLSVAATIEPGLNRLELHAVFK